MLNNNNKQLSATELIWCRCGYGFCEPRKSRSKKNNGRMYFACPIKRGASCGTFLKWCDAIVKRDFQPPLFKYPECQCGAGVYRKVLQTGHRCYFVCPVEKGRGSCGYRVSEYELLNKASNAEPVNNTNIVPIRHSSHRADTAVKNLANDLAEGSDLLTKRMRVTDRSKNPIEIASSQPVGFPEIEFEDDLELIASLDEIEAEARLKFEAVCSQPIGFREIEFEDDDLELINNLVFLDEIEAEACLKFEAVCITNRR